jgi:hypothetical protein
MSFRLSDIRKPLEDVVFPNGAKHVPVPWGPAEYELWRDAQEATDQREVGAMVLKIVTASYPTATEYDLDSCLDEDGTTLIALAAYAGRKIEQVRTALKNVAAAGEVASPPPSQATTTPSSRKTSGATSSRKSRARSAKTGGTPTTASLTASLNLPGTATTSSTTSSASMPSDAKSTTSTASASSPAP